MKPTMLRAERMICRSYPSLSRGEALAEFEREQAAADAYRAAETRDWEARHPEVWTLKELAREERAPCPLWPVLLLLAVFVFVLATASRWSPVLERWLP